MLHSPSSLDGPWRRLNLSGFSGTSGTWDWTHLNLGLESHGPLVLANGSVRTFTRALNAPQPAPASSSWLVIRSLHCSAATAAAAAAAAAVKCCARARVCVSGCACLHIYIYCGIGGRGQLEWELQVHRRDRNPALWQDLNLPEYPLLRARSDCIEEY